MNDTLYQVLFFMFFIISLTTIITFIILVIRIIISRSRRRSLPQKHLFYSIILLMLSLILGYNQYFNLEYLPSGVLNATITSPNEKYVIKTYHFDGIYGDNAKAVLINLSNGDNTREYPARIIFKKKNLKRKFDHINMVTVVKTLEKECFLYSYFLYFKLSN